MPRGDADFEEHIRNRTQHPPAVVYKYMTADTARIILSTGRLRFQSPYRYNDPFDSQWDVHWPLLTPEAKAFERDLLDRAIRDPGSWPDDADPAHRTAMNRERARINALPEVDQEDAIRALVNDLAHWSDIPIELRARLLDIRHRMRILCVSVRNDSILMWSHYTDNHRGVILGLSSEKLEHRWKRPLLPVQYSEGPPRLIDHESWIRASVFGNEDRAMPGRLWEQWALTKHCGWCYEKEWRFATHEPRGTLGDYRDIDFPADALVEIATGCRTDEVAAQELRALAHSIHPQVRCYRMSMDPTRFALVKSEVE